MKRIPLIAAALMGSALRNGSADGRSTLFRQGEKLALDDMALIPLVNNAAAALRSDRYVGLNLDYDGDPTLATAALT